MRDYISYTVTGTGANGCYAQSPAEITIKVIPEITSILHNIEICKGDRALLDAVFGPNYTVHPAGVYTVRISNGLCSKIIIANVFYITTPEIVEIVYNNSMLTVIVKNKGNLPLEYSLDGG